jgi:hypothetical protein
METKIIIHLTNTPSGNKIKDVLVFGGILEGFNNGRSSTVVSKIWTFLCSWADFTQRQVLRNFSCLSQHRAHAPNIVRRKKMPCQAASQGKKRDLHRSIFSKTVPSTLVFANFLLSICLLENHSILFETCTFVKIL